MEEIIIATFKLRGKIKDIAMVKARIAAFSSYEEVISLYIRSPARKRVEIGGEKTT